MPPDIYRGHVDTCGEQYQATVSGRNGELAGEAQLLILPDDGDSELVSYTPDAAVPFSPAPTDTLPSPPQ
jgi:hypothetical protein